MLFLSTAAASLALLSATASAMPLQAEKRQAVDGTFGLSVGEEGLFDISEVQTFKFSYANNSAYFGEIKYQQYSEPLVLSGAKVAGDTEGGLSFLSIHSSPTGWQNAYIEPTKTAPLQFTLPHAGGNMPADAVSTGFSFSGGGPLLWNGENKFWACQNPQLVALNTYQIWWNGAGKFPLGVDCKGPIGADMIDGCQRGN
ncbi:uncharacterized protein Z520_07823 [Fonsecaea multimorphosa CBS 102226]|uniref:Uncharacterized protein n=1 Tax=Fonsecaea multimorphosa CBS 102226 TaxID=1442371 RepID=A0A0D2JSW3_9EURO|nr:uncharacterized protein Z520_07823 [Fonsecaea multimorphosa CBS 102226]KIX96557.1 hypothetical protein Z520_07823 [Fonsecaea multimorphosa CBS 102226]OAL22170.1 hypothetical protein AYO22_07431 [Fonsecaea multimorphosa]